MFNRLARLIELACLMEATARKPGNVHPEASFDDLTYADFVASAKVASPPLSQALVIGVGPSIEAAVRATREVVASNTNLGIALLIAPLAAVPPLTSLEVGIPEVLANLTVADAEAVYRAIRIAQPGGMGRAETEDVAERPTHNLVEVMRLAADRDRIARQYISNFTDVLSFGRDRLHYWRTVRPDCWESLVIGLHLSLLAEFPDSLIARKCGLEVAQKTSRFAIQVLEAGWPERLCQGELAKLDNWLRSDGNRRNPGTTADLVAATLFADVRERESLPTPQPGQLLEDQFRRIAGVYDASRDEQ
ncbi:MAG: triphosphoribosyl-dephospho-CoA synthase [Planctomycetaceae bacterium]